MDKGQKKQPETHLTANGLLKTVLSKKVYPNAEMMTVQNFERKIRTGGIRKEKDET